MIISLVKLFDEKLYNLASRATSRTDDNTHRINSSHLSCTKCAICFIFPALDDPIKAKNIQSRE